MARPPPTSRLYIWGKGQKLASAKGVKSTSRALIIPRIPLASKQNGFRIWCVMEIMNNKNNLYLIIGVLLVLVAGLGIYIYRQEHKPQGLEIRIDENGLKVEGNGR
jgi:hypothetical protein